MEKYMKIALKLAKKAYKNGDVPVGAVIVENNKIIGKGYNKRQKLKNVTRHAEIIALEKACKKKKNWYLNDCEIYITLEPCMMCMGAIKQAHIKKIYFSTENIKCGYNKINKNMPIIEKNIYKEESINLLKSFFKNKR